MVVTSDKCSKKEIHKTELTKQLHLGNWFEKINLYRGTIEIVKMWFIRKHHRNVLGGEDNGKSNEKKEK